MVAPICTLFTLFLILNNLSLTLNPTSFFQLAKILTVPSVILFNYLFFHKSVSRYKLGVVAVACVGVGLASGAGIRSNPLGTFVAILAFTSTALYQIWIGRMLDRKVEGMEIGAPVLLMNQTGVSMCVLACLVPFLDTLPNLGMLASALHFYFLKLTFCSDGAVVVDYCNGLSWIRCCIDQLESIFDYWVDVGAHVQHYRHHEDGAYSDHGMVCGRQSSGVVGRHRCYDGY